LIIHFQHICTGTQYIEVYCTSGQHPTTPSSASTVRTTLAPIPSGLPSQTTKSPTTSTSASFATPPRRISDVEEMPRMSSICQLTRPIDSVSVRPANLPTHPASRKVLWMWESPSGVYSISFFPLENPKSFATLKLDGWKGGVSIKNGQTDLLPK